MKNRPRESRDSLFLVGVLTWTMAPQFGAVPLWCSLFAVTALVWRGMLSWRGSGMPPRRVLMLALPLAVGLSLWSHGHVLGKETGLSLLVSLTALKTLEMRTQRDRFVVCFLGMLLIMAGFLRSQSMFQGLAMLVSVTGLLTCLMLEQRPNGRPDLWETARLAMMPALLGAPIVLVLFLFFPRLPPLWGLPEDAGAHTGLSDQLELGQIADAALDDSLAMQVTFDGPPPPPQERYFRAQVLSVHIGQRWLAPNTALSAPITPTPRFEDTLNPSAIGYRMTLEPLQIRALPLLEHTLSMPIMESATAVDLIRHKDMHWQSLEPLTQRMQLHALAVVIGGVIPTEATPFPIGDLDLPEGLHLRTRAWAQALRQSLSPDQSNPEQLAEKLLQHIRTAGFSYSLSPGESPESDPVDAFWLDHRQGFCEHFASTFVILMRAMGVPARIVTGYQGGLINPIDKVLEIRQSDAHAWAEYWSRGRGWIRVDPTAAVAPDRINAGVHGGNAGGGGLRKLLGPWAQLSPDMRAQLQALWGSVDHRWRQWVVQYHSTEQFDLLKGLGWSEPDFDDLGEVLEGLAALGLGTLAGWTAWRRWQQRGDPWLRTWTALQADLRRHGWLVQAHHSPATLARQIPELATVLLELDAWRYAPASQRPRLQNIKRTLRRALRELKHATDDAPKQQRM
ncbi:transglutaminaseTgpA domain-containing protein [Leptothrix ochracea]|uniref:transglutaminase family protein n=1 Tax=Leptothrix ochracea TaxID=735331 RepID=UPI0034E2F530